MTTTMQPVVQFIASTIPFALLLLWFLFSAHIRPNEPCYEEPYLYDDDAVRNDMQDECSRLVPLKQYLYIFIGMLFLWSLLALYLSFYVPRRHALIEAYLTQGETVIGDVYYNRMRRGVLGYSSYGSAIYRNPANDDETLKRRVRVFERYTRERAAIVYLPGMPLSGQPKVDLEIDREIFTVNKRRVQILTYYAWAWVVFCLLAPLYIVHVLKSLASDNPSSIQPDRDVDDFPMWYYLSAFLFIPVAAILCNLISWLLHKRWMTNQHKVMKDGEVEEPRGCCFDDGNCEEIKSDDYQPPSVKVMSRDEGEDKGNVA